MSRYVFKLPDLGEGTVEAEIVGWRVKPGDVVAEDDVIVEVMTEKAAVEVPAPVSGRVVSTTGSPGDMVPVGADLIVFETVAASESAQAPAAPAPSVAESTAAQPAAAQPAAANPQSGAGRANGAAHAATGGAGNATTAGASRAPATRPGPSVSADETSDAREAAAESRRVATSPAIRRRAREAGVDLARLSGSGPNGRILREDFEAFVSSRAAVTSARPGSAGHRARASAPATEEIKVIGLRRLIAQRMSDAKRNIPHFAYVEEVDITELERLRRHLSAQLEPGAAALTYLPFIVIGLVRVLRDFPQCNALYDADRGVIVRHGAVHVGVATQTPDGLKVPVVHDAQNLTLWELAAQIRRVSEAARTNKATRAQLSGSTITVTSLGKLGGIVSTPIINAPEVAIIGINRAVERPMVVDGAIAVRRMMNVSSSFDHRFVDGYDAAAMIQALKERHEQPATLFIG